ncbi:hypothetical protein CHS0354_013632 [Potamilus streckersoni]|uniref:Regulator of G-protein signaling 3 n=1 Tax=Potamilus streckersoni TaxID=2493646 RepID=A0AAE0SKQ4_9BIVA|nr:hypothetical protein CHS0354_013632 [Potamilus streckersoni]
MKRIRDDDEHVDMIYSLERTSSSANTCNSILLAGQLKVSMYMNFGLLTVHVIQGRQLSSKLKPLCDSFVQLTLIPDNGKQSKCKTEVIHDSNNPLYDEKFSFELTEEDLNKRLLISTWHYDQSSSSNQFLGCMSFGVRHLKNPKKDSSGWYYLLTEDIGKRKHLQVSSRQKPQLKLRSQTNIPSINKDVWGLESLQINLTRGKHGFGFSVVEGCPVKVGRVDGASPAEQAGLHKDDIIIRVNGQNVSRSTAVSVAKLVKHSSNNLCIEVQRSQELAYDELDYPTVQPTATCPSFHGNQVTSDPPKSQEENIYNTIYEEPLLDYGEASKENEISVDEDALFNTNISSSTPLPLLCNGHKTMVTTERRKQEAVHRLLSLELDFVDLMHSGMQRYSRPLRHCILTNIQHFALFQNIEKLTIISEYHVKQMHDNIPSMTSDDTDTSADSHHFVNSVGLIYQSKVHMLCQAYELYAKGISEANKLLSDLRKSEDFIKFLSKPSLKGRQPSINTFIFRPVQHIRELYQVLREIFINTAAESTDYSCLKQVAEGLQECVNNITNFSCERVESLTSINSKDSRGSFTESMKSQSSSESSSSRSSSSAPKCTTGLLQNVRTVDTEVMKIQDRLVFAPHVPIMKLCQEERHVIFSGDLFMWEGQQWVKLQVFLFTDIVLPTRKEPDGFLHVLEPPTHLRDVYGIDAQRKHGTEFVLHRNGKGSSSQKLHFRAPSTEQKYAWKSLLEQRVYAVRGKLEYVSSSSDLSSASSAVVI